MNMDSYIDLLMELNACPDAIEWSKNYTTPQEAWKKCKRGDWMLWLIANLDKSKPFSEQRKPLVTITLKCARLAWQWMPQEARECLELHERWIGGEDISIKEFNKARNAAAHAATYAATNTVYAAAYAAYIVTNAATYAATNAAYAAHAAAHAAEQKIWKQAAEIIGSHYPDIEEVIGEKAT